MRKLSLKLTHFAKPLSSLSGLNLFADLIYKFEFQRLISGFLPKKKRERGLKSFEKIFAGILGFVAGIECLDDFDWISHDVLFDELAGSPSSITMGKFLRSFSLRQIEQMGNELPTLAYKMRLWLSPKLTKIIFSMDSTDHEQYGIKSEGVDFGYRGFRCLNSQNMFDDKGLSYGFKLRKGNTYSGDGAVEMIHKTFSVISKDVRKYFRADSAYSNLHVYNILLNHNCHFALCLKENSWSPLLEKYGSKIVWRKSRLRFFESDKCEVGSCLYPLKGLAGRSFLRVVFIRTKRKEIKVGENHPYYHHYAVVTDMSESEMDNERVLLFYRGRSQVENYIKDLKNGMDFHHFPCMSLKANNVWGLMGIFAYNLMRLASFTISPNGCFVKTTRRKMVTMAGELVKHARYVEIRMNPYLAKEYERQKMILSDAFFRPNGRMVGNTC